MPILQLIVEVLVDAIAEWIGDTLCGWIGYLVVMVLTLGRVHLDRRSCADEMISHYAGLSFLLLVGGCIAWILGR
jgi:hypothetical protein